MYIDSISLNNVRGFQQLNFSLARPEGRYAGWTVFTGGNGSGKSSVLKAIAVALAGKDNARALQPTFQHWVRAGQTEASIELKIVRTDDDDSLTGGGAPPGGKFPVRIKLKDSGREPQLEAATPAGKPQNYSIPQRTIWSPDASGWFACGYGPFRRVFGASPEATRQMVAPSTERFVTMFQEAASLAEVDQWLRNLSHKALEQRPAETSQLGILLNILRDDLMPNQITVDRINSDGLWLRDRNGLQLPWGEMSDGYRAALALLSDILRHLINAYGVDNLVENDSTGRLRVKRSGVVLVDEIDAHLHPEWQREIGFWLKDHFPNIQFIVTTHSPLICQAADMNGLFVLPGPGSDDEPHAITLEEYQTIIASRPDTILRTSAFGLQNTRSPRAVEGRSEYARLVSKQHAGGVLSNDEQQRMLQLKLFVETKEEL